MTCPLTNHSRSVPHRRGWWLAELPGFDMREVAGKIGEKVGVRELPEAQGGIRHSIILPMEEPTPQ